VPKFSGAEPEDGRRTRIFSERVVRCASAPKNTGMTMTYRHAGTGCRSKAVGRNSRAVMTIESVAGRETCLGPVGARQDAIHLDVPGDLAGLPARKEQQMSLGWRVTFIHTDHQHIVLVGIEDKDAARAAAIGDRTGVSASLWRK
jgi:hypothetical protein